MVIKRVVANIANATRQGKRIGAASGPRAKEPRPHWERVPTL